MKGSAIIADSFVLWYSVFLRKKALKIMKLAVIVGVTGALFVPNAVRQIPASATSIKEVQKQINDTEKQIKDSARFINAFL